MANKAVVSIGVDFTKGLDEGLKKLNSAIDNSKIAKGMQEQIQEMRKEIKELEKDIKKTYAALDKNKISTKEFEKFKKTTITQITDVQNSVTTLMSSMGDFAKNDFAANVTDGFKGLKQVIQGCNSELVNFILTREEATKFHVFANETDTINIDEIKKKGTGVKEYKQTSSDYFKVDDEIAKLQDDLEAADSDETIKSLTKDLIEAKIVAYNLAEGMVRLKKEIPEVGAYIKEKGIQSEIVQAEQDMEQYKSLFSTFQDLKLSKIGKEGIKFVLSDSSETKPTTDASPLPDDYESKSLAEVQRVIKELQTYLESNPLYLDLQISEEDEQKIKDSIATILEDIKKIQGIKAELVRPEQTSDDSEKEPAQNIGQKELEGAQNQSDALLEKLQKVADKITEIKESIPGISEAFSKIDDSKLSKLEGLLEKINVSIEAIIKNIPQIGDAVDSANKAAKNAKQANQQSNNTQNGTGQVPQTPQIVNFKPNTDGFSEIVMLLGIAEDKAKNIKDIVKESRINSQGTYDESYNVRYKDGSSYRYEGVNGNIVNANERVKNDNAELERQKNLYDQINAKLKKLEELKTKQAKGTATRYETGQISVLENELTKLRSDPILSKEQFDESGRELQRITEKVKELQRVTNSKNAAKRVDAIQNYLGGLDSERAFVVRTENKPQENMTSTEIEKVRNLKLALGEYEAQLKALKKEDYVTEAQLKQVEDARQGYLAAKAVIQQMPRADKGAAAVGVSKMLNNIDKYMSKNSAMSAKYKRQLQALKQELIDKGPGANLADIQSRFERLQVEIREAGQEGKRFLDVIKEKAWYGLATQLGTYFNLNSLISGMRRGIEVVKEMDSALTEMRKVSDESLSSLKSYQKESFAFANSVGTTAQQIQKSTADWMRLGESMTEATESAKVSNILFNVSEFENIDAATDALVSMSAAYKDVEKLDIVNKMNKIGNEYSISTDGLATSLQDSASSLITAGNSLDEAIALTTAGNAVSQDPSKVGSGLRTISLRLVGTKAAREALNELGEETDDFITSSKLRQTIKQATSAATENGEGFDVLDSNGNYKSTYQIMLGLSELYDKIQQKDKEMGTNNLNLLLETIAGEFLPERYRNIFYSTYLIALAA